jgi:photosystem II stability/assembly factor-like uncharacterized protein
MKKLLLFITLFVCSTSIALAQWQKTDGISGIDVLCTAVDSAKIYAGTPNGIFISSDKGDSWTKLPPVSTEAFQNHITELIVNGSKIYATTLTLRTFVSTNSGNSWTSLTFPLAPAGAFKLITAIDKYIMILASNGISTSEDGGIQ